MKRRRSSILVIVLMVLFLLLTGCGVLGGDESAEEPAETATQTMVDETEMPESEVTAESEGESDEAEILGGVEVGTRTPMPTATPGFLVEGVSQITEDLGLDQQTFLGLGLDDWIILGLGLLLILVTYILATWLVRRIFPRWARRTETQIDDRLLEIAGKDRHRVGGSQFLWNSLSYFYSYFFISRMQ